MSGEKRVELIDGVWFFFAVLSCALAYYHVHKADACAHLAPEAQVECVKATTK